MAVWLALTGGLAASGLLARFELRPPPFAVFFGGTLFLAVILGFSRVGTRFVTGVPLWMLIAAQSFRLPLEFVMRQAARDGIMPVQMSFEGWNFDVVSGSTAIVVAWLAARGAAPRWLLMAWNALGSMLLLAIIAIAVVSTPMLHAFGTEPRDLNTWVAFFPYVWLPAVLVAAALFGHLIITRKLFAKVTLAS